MKNNTPRDWSSAGVFTPIMRFRHCAVGCSRKNRGMIGAAEFPPRHYFRFQLRSLLLFTTLVGLSLGQLSERGRKQREAVGAICHCGARYEYPPDGSICSAVQAGIARLLGKDFVYAVVEIWPDANQPENFERLKDLPGLSSAAIEGEFLDGPKLEMFLRWMPHLSKLAIYEDHALVPADIARLQHFPNLRGLVLVFDSNPLCEAFWDEASRIKHLVEFELVCPWLTDRMVDQLGRATQMRRILISPRYKDTLAQVQALKTVLPHCSTYVQQCGCSSEREAIEPAEIFSKECTDAHAQTVHRMDGSLRQLRRRRLFGG